MSEELYCIETGDEIYEVSVITNTAYRLEVRPEGICAIHITNNVRRLALLLTLYKYLKEGK